MADDKKPDVSRPCAGSDRGARTSAPIPADVRKRTVCTCCGQRATHFGLGDGMVLTSGCGWYVRQWVRDPLEAIRMANRMRAKRPPAPRPVTRLRG